MSKFKYLPNSLLAQNIEDKQFKLVATNFTIYPQLLDKHILMYNGKEYKSILITKDHLNKKITDFVLTRKHCIHNRPKIKNKIRIKK